MPKRNTRRTLTPSFKFRVALEAAKGQRSINEISAEHRVHPTQVTTWKKELLDGGSVLFERKNGRDRENEAQEAHTAELERALGRAVVEKEFLVKKCKQLGIQP